MSSFLGARAAKGLSLSLAEVAGMGGGGGGAEGEDEEGVSSSGGILFDTSVWKSKKGEIERGS